MNSAKWLLTSSVLILNGQSCFNVLPKSNTEPNPTTPYSPMMDPVGQKETRKNTGELETVCDTIIDCCQGVKKRLSEPEQPLDTTLLNKEPIDDMIDESKINPLYGTQGKEESIYEEIDESNINQGLKKQTAG